MIILNANIALKIDELMEQLEGTKQNHLDEKTKKEGEQLDREDKEH